MSGRRARVLLIGNSRWHWAEGPDPVPEPQAPGCPSAGDRRAQALALGLPDAWICADGPPAEPGAWAEQRILAWAAVGPMAADQLRLLPASRRLQTPQVPLAGLPAWIGVDRALVAWQAWCRQQCLGSAPVLVVDAGTVLSLTLVSRQGRFLGGRLLAGAALQWRAMAAGTANLPELEVGAAAAARIGERTAEGAEDLWPQATASAMAIGVIEGLAAAVIQAYGQLSSPVRPSADRPPGEWEAMEDLRLWICGGDGAQLVPPLRQAGVPLVEAPHLAMEALIRLAPLNSDPDR